jgi:hypothetical protein
MLRKTVLRQNSIVPAQAALTRSITGSDACSGLHRDLSRQHSIPPSTTKPFLDNLWPHLATPQPSLMSIQMKSYLSSSARVPDYAARLSYL